MGLSCEKVFGYVERGAGAALALIVFAAYIRTLAPGVTFWDSGELILGGLTLGIPHPPGSPAYCILGKALSFIPLGSGAFRINVMSAVFGALGAYMVYLLSVRLTGGGPVGVAAGLAAGVLYGLAGPTWSVSVVAEVYTLASFLMLVVALLIVMHQDGGGVRCLYAAGFVLGLSAATHQSALFILPAYVLYAVLGGRLYAAPRRAVAVAAFALLGFSSVLYLPVRSHAAPALDIGSPDTLGGIGWVMKLTENLDTLGKIFERLPRLVEFVGAWYVLGAVVALAVLVVVLRKNPAGLFVLVSAAVTLAFVTMLTKASWGLMKWGQTEKFYVLAITYGLPLGALIVTRILERAAGGGARVPAGLAGAACSALLAVWLIYAGASGMDRTSDRFARTFAEDTLKSVGNGSLLVGWGDNGTFPVWYLMDWERYRDDVLFVHGELLSYGWYAENIGERVREKYGVDFRPAEPFTDIKATVNGLRRVLRGRERIYLDFSAAFQLEYDTGKFHPQGLAYMDMSGYPRSQSLIWETMGMTPLIESGADRGFATEGVLDIYGYQCFVWGGHACFVGYVPEANRAFDEAEVLAPGKYTARCLGSGVIDRLGSSFTKSGG